MEDQLQQAIRLKVNEERKVEAAEKKKEEEELKLMIVEGRIKEMEELLALGNQQGERQERDALMLKDKIEAMKDKVQDLDSEIKLSRENIHDLLEKLMRMEFKETEYQLKILKLEWEYSSKERVIEETFAVLKEIQEEIKEAKQDIDMISSAIAQETKNLAECQDIEHTKKGDVIGPVTGICIGYAAGGMAGIEIGREIGGMFPCAYDRKEIIRRDAERDAIRFKIQELEKELTRACQRLGELHRHIQVTEDKIVEHKRKKQSIFEEIEEVSSIQGEIRQQCHEELGKLESVMKKLGELKKESQENQVHIQSQTTRMDYLLLSSCELKEQTDSLKQKRTYLEKVCQRLTNDWKILNQAASTKTQELASLKTITLAQVRKSCEKDQEYQLAYNHLQRIMNAEDRLADAQRVHQGINSILKESQTCLEARKQGRKTCLQSIEKKIRQNIKRQEYFKDFEKYMSGQPTKDWVNVLKNNDFNGILLQNH